jgi:hypothetical protein
VVRGDSLPLAIVLTWLSSFTVDHATRQGRYPGEHECFFIFLAGMV